MKIWPHYKVELKLAFSGTRFPKPRRFWEEKCPISTNFLFSHLIPGNCDAAPKFQSRLCFLKGLQRPF